MWTKDDNKMKRGLEDDHMSCETMAKLISVFFCFSFMAGETDDPGECALVIVFQLYATLTGVFDPCCFFLRKEFEF